MKRSLNPTAKVLWFLFAVPCVLLAQASYCLAPTYDLLAPDFGGERSRAWLEWYRGYRWPAPITGTGDADVVTLPVRTRISLGDLTRAA